MEDPELLTEWDLREELREGIPLEENLQQRRQSRPNATDGDRPITKDSDGEINQLLIVFYDDLVFVRTVKYYSESLKFTFVGQIRCPQKKVRLNEFCTYFINN